jgi:hypothetical protein
VSSGRLLFRSKPILKETTPASRGGSLRNPFPTDALAVLRPQLDESEIAQAIRRGMLHEGKPYDFDFDFSRFDRLVCTEVVYRSNDGIGRMHFLLRRRVGRMTIAAKDLPEMALDRDSFEPIAVYAPAWEPRVVCGADTYRLLRSSLGKHGPAPSLTPSPRPGVA